MGVIMQVRIGMVIQALLAASIFYLGYTIYAFTSAIVKVVDTYPQVMQDINATADKLEIEQWLLVAKTFEKIAPQAIALAAEIKSTVGDVNQTISSVDQKIPLVLDEVKVIRTITLPSVVNTIDTINNKTVPETLSELARYREDVIPPFLKESQAHRKTTIPTVVTESEYLRRDVPIILAKVEEIVEQSEQLTQEATQGAVKGVILSPINLLRDAGEGLRFNSEPANNEVKN